MEGKAIGNEVHGEDIDEVAGVVVDQEHGVGTVEVVGHAAAVYRQRMISKLAHKYRKL